MRGAAVFVLLCCLLMAQQAGIEGTAVNSVTGEPLRGVHIRLFTRSPKAASIVYGAMSDSNGHFSISGMQVGTYSLQPQKTGFVFPFKSVILKTGQRLTDFKLVMIPRAVIAGRVLDERGLAVPNVTVQLEPLSDTTAPIGLSGRTSTNDRGEFHFSGFPGKYRIKAIPRKEDDEEIRTDGSFATPYGTTYYPSAARTSQASVVEAVAGGDTTGIDIRLMHRSRGLTISGVVTGIPEAGRSATIMLQSGETLDELTAVEQWSTSADGKFRTTDLDRQHYIIFAQYKSGKATLQSQKLELKPDSGDVTNLELVLNPGAEVAGKLEILGDPPGTAEKRTLRLAPVEPTFSSAQTVEVDKDGGFRVSTLPPDRYQVRVEPLPDNAYLKAITLDGSPVRGAIVDLSHVRASNLKITVSRSGAQISGTVLDKDGEPLVNTTAVVYLLDAPGESGPEHQTRVTAEGKYSFTRIPPGKYRLIGMDRVRSVLLPDDDAMKKLFAAAEEIEIKESARIVKDVKVVE